MMKDSGGVDLLWSVTAVTESPALFSDGPMFSLVNLFPLAVEAFLCVLIFLASLNSIWPLASLTIAAILRCLCNVSLFLLSSLSVLTCPVCYFSHSSCAVASLLSWTGLPVYLLSWHKPSQQLAQSSFPRECSAAVVGHCWSISSGLSHLLAVLVRRCMTCPVWEWSWVDCGDLLWAGVSRLSVLGQVQGDSIVQLLHPLLVLLTLEVTGSENSAHRPFCSICTLTEPRSVILQCS